MEIKDYISGQEDARQNILASIHKTIIETDKSVIARVEKMMGKEMIIYKAQGQMKYGLASVKKYMSLHLLPIYASNALHLKYEALLTKAAFQKGCINFENEEEMPMDIVGQLIADCSEIDLLKMKEEYLKKKK